MDIISHLLTGISASYLFNLNRTQRKPVILFSILPDIGEIPIQLKLTQVYNSSSVGIYDGRTSNIEVASNLSVTWLYDLTHSLTLPAFYILFAWMLGNNFKYFYYVSLGLFLHFLLDVTTHGKIWALKIFFPFSNQRFPFFEDVIGNWWEWKPAIQFSFLPLKIPIVIFVYWSVLTCYLLFVFHKKTKNI